MWPRHNQSQVVGPGTRPRQDLGRSALQQPGHVAQRRPVSGGRSGLIAPRGPWVLGPATTWARGPEAIGLWRQVRAHGPERTLGARPSNNPGVWPRHNQSQVVGPGTRPRQDLGRSALQQPGHVAQRRPVSGGRSGLIAPRGPWVLGPATTRARGPEAIGLRRQVRAHGPERTLGARPSNNPGTWPRDVRSLVAGPGTRPRDDRSQPHWALGPL